jgi:hypothetical protein
MLLTTIARQVPAVIAGQLSSGPELITRTVLAQQLQQAATKLTCWTVRKAEEQGLIQPDKTGRFAGHIVHYYDPARIPDLIRLLRPLDSWTAGTLVVHSRLGPGRIWTADPSDPAKRVVTFFVDATPVTVPVAELRRLLSATVTAQRIGANRKSFVKVAAQRGIEPDYADGRNFYDERRIQEIRERFFSAVSVNSAQGGSFVVDAQEEVARIEYVGSNGQVRMRTVDDCRLIETDTSSLRRLVSTRELARLEDMSRYKLNRLLHAAGVQPVHRDKKTLYFDLDRSRRAVRTRVGREDSATTLRDVAQRCGVSPELLARKVRQGCIRTIGSSNHAVDESEAQRIQHVERARRHGWQRLREAGICRLQPRGRYGHEVVGWDVSRLLQVAQVLSSQEREALFDEVAWACDGAGQRRFQEALEHELWNWRISPGAHRRPVAYVLLTLVARLPKFFAPCRDHVTLIASGAPQRYRLDNARLRLLASQAGCGTEQARVRFITHIDRQVVELLSGENAATFLTGVDRVRVISGLTYPDDEFIPGAVTLFVNEKKPIVGMIVRIDQRSWNPMKRGWDKTVVVRSGSQEHRINPSASATNLPTMEHDASFRVLLGLSDTVAVGCLMRDMATSNRTRAADEILLRCVS